MINLNNLHCLFCLENIYSDREDVYHCDEFCTSIIYRNNQIIEFDFHINIENYLYFIHMSKDNLFIYKSKEINSKPFDTNYDLVGEFNLIIDMESFNKKYIIKLIKKLVALKTFS